MVCASESKQWLVQQNIPITSFKVLQMEIICLKKEGTK